ncbi:hypothetical protein GJAV_G00089270 [Gymnothorax javanicus]|nr:hypothetical protein GJAV_G00089270 [Gymnothorax javanicus]
MSMMNFFGVLILILCISLLGTDGYFLTIQTECRYSSRDLHDLEYIARYIHEKLEVIRYNSTLKKYIGYTDLGIFNAENWNSDGSAEAKYAALDGYCRPNALKYFPHIRDKAAEPTIRIKSVTHGSRKHTSMLVCSAYDFFPKGIKLTWLRDGKEVKSDVTTTEELANGNWFYQIHSHLEYTPKSGEAISCKVEHASLREGREVKWDPTIRNPLGEFLSRQAKVQSTRTWIRKMDSMESFSLLKTTINFLSE